MDKLKMREEINELLYNGQYEELIRLFLDNQETATQSNDFALIYVLFPVWEQEKNAGQRTVFEKERNMEALIARSLKLKFYLRRIEFDVMDGNMNEFYEFLVQNAVSSYELLAAIDYNVIDKDKVLQIIRERN